MVVKATCDLFKLSGSIGRKVILVSHASGTWFTLSAKLIFGFLLVVVPSLSIMVAASLYALWDLASVNRELQEISSSLEQVQGLETAVARTVTPLSAFLVDGAAGHERRFEASIHEVDVRLKGCSSSACHGASGQSSTMAASLAPYIQSIRDRAAIVFARGEPPTAQGKVRVLHEINLQNEEANRRLERMASALLLRVSFLQEKSQQVDQRASALIMVTASMVLALAAMGAWLLSRRLLRHVGALLTGTRKIMQGELGYRVAVTQPDEVGQLAGSFNAMAQELQEHREHLERIVDARTAELRQAQDSLVQSEKLASIGLLAAGVAHELNNPLTSILMNVSLLREDAGNQPVLRAELQRISEDTVRCKRIIDDLRDFSRRQELDIAPTDLNTLVRDALGLLGRSTRLQGIDVTSELSNGIPPVPCDPARMEQVLGNILVNAAQAMPQGGSLMVGTSLGTGFAEISVRDTGPGVPDAIRGRIFDPFFTTKPQGTGLGLSIVYRIMEAHGGKVDVYSIKRDDPQGSAGGQAGTRVLLSLPLGAAQANDDVAPDA